jgi:hypothetical protein
MRGRNDSDVHRHRKSGKCRSPCAATCTATLFLTLAPELPLSVCRGDTLNGTLRGSSPALAGLVLPSPPPTPLSVVLRELGRRPLPRASWASRRR